MQLGTHQFQVQTRTLALTMQSIQAIEVLQFGQQELHDFLAAQAEKNPLLDIRNPLASAPRPDQSYRPPASSGRSFSRGELRDIAETHASPSTLRAHLRAQVGMTFRDPQDRRIAAEITDSIDPDGFLRRPLWQIADLIGIEEERIEALLTRVHGFDPVGVGARNLAECLRLQLADRGELTAPMAALLDHLPLLANSELDRLARLCGVDRERVMQMARALRKLNPAPGRQFDGSPILPALPDVLVKEIAPGEFSVELNPELLPRVLVDQQYYAEVAAKSPDSATRSYITSCFRSANFLSRQLDQRAQTVLKVTTEIVAQQRQFLMHGITYLRPLDLKKVAAAVGVHESTVCRAVANKYMMTARGLFELKFFFAGGLGGDSDDAVATATIRHRIRQLVDAENPQDILSDDQIVAQLTREGIEIARRTVAKYRGMLNIPSSSVRRRQKLLMAS